MDVRRCLLSASYNEWRTWCVQYYTMQLPNKVEKSLQWKQSFCYSSRLKCIVACRDCRRTKCKNVLILELIEVGQNHIGGRFDNNIFDDISSLWFFEIF